MKKYICVVLSLLFVFSSVFFCASAAETDTPVPFSCTVCAEEPSYEKGEEIRILVSLQKTSLDAVTDMRIWMDYPQTDYYLTPGVTERFIETLGIDADGIFRVSEDEGVLAFASKFDNTKLIKKFLLVLAHAYKRLTLAFTTVRYRVQNNFISLLQHTEELGKVTVMYDNTEIEFTVRCRYSVHKSAHNDPVKMSDDTGMVSAEVKAVENSYTGLTFAMEEDGQRFGLFAVHPDTGKAAVYEVKDGIYSLLASKSVPVEAGKFYQMKLIADGGRVRCYLLYDPLDTDPYPLFDIDYDTTAGGYGVYCGTDDCRNFTVTPAQIPAYEKTYTNPVCENAADPYVLKDGSLYYLYATTDADSGFRVSVSEDLVNWEQVGYCAKKGDIYGNGSFWAPEVYHYNGKYYMLYSTDSHPALAVSDSPTGPFVKTKDGYLLEDECIDGHLLFDDNGAVYLYMAYWAETGEEIWGCRMKNDLSGAVPGTLTRLTSCKEDEGGVNEGPWVMKYEGKYYLTYSVNGYENKNYAVRLAVADAPLGTYEDKGTILERSGSVVGTGHHSFTVSPDGTELMIAYHCHYSTTQVHGRKLCIDRCKFVRTEDGYTISVYGPTSTAQPYPSNQ